MSPKVLAAVRRRFSRCFSWAGGGPLGVQQFLACQRERDASRAVPAQGERLPAAIETVVVTESDGARRRYRHVHAIPVGSLVWRGLGLNLCSAGSVNIELLPPGYDVFYHQGPGDVKMSWNPHETKLFSEPFTVQTEKEWIVNKRV